MPSPAPSRESTSSPRKRKRSDSAPGLFTKVAPNAVLTYIINVMRGTDRVIPPIKLNHSDNPEACCFPEVIAHCSTFHAPITVQVNTPGGFETVTESQAWDRAVRAVYDEEIMDGVVRVRIDIHEPVTIE